MGRSRSPASPTPWAAARSAASPTCWPRTWVSPRPRSTACAASGTRRAWRPREGLKAVDMFEAIERRRDQGAVGDGDQSGRVAAARRRSARRAAASSICSSCPRTCSSNDTVNAGAHIAAAGRRLGREGRHRHQFRAPHLAPARLPAAPGRGKPDWWIVCAGGAAHGLWRRLRLPLGRRYFPRACGAVGFRE